MSPRFSMSWCLKSKCCRFLWCFSLSLSFLFLWWLLVVLEKLSLTRSFKFTKGSELELRFSPPNGWILESLLVLISLAFHWRPTLSFQPSWEISINVRFSFFFLPFLGSSSIFIASSGFFWHSVIFHGDGIMRVGQHFIQSSWLLRFPWFRDIHRGPELGWPV